MFDAAERVTGPRLKGGAESDWDGAIAKAAAGLRARDGKVAAIVGDASNEEGFLVGRILREALGSPHLDSRPAARRRASRRSSTLAEPGAAGEPSPTSTRPT